MTDQPPRKVTIIPPEDPEEVRRRDRAHWNDIDLEDEVWTDDEEED